MKESRRQVSVPQQSQRRGFVSPDAIRDNSKKRDNLEEEGQYRRRGTIQKKRDNSKRTRRQVSVPQQSQRRGFISPDAIRGNSKKRDNTEDEEQYRRRGTIQRRQ
jgi:hypothetical protein